MPAVGDCNQHINGAIRPSLLAHFHDNPSEECEESQSQSGIFQNHDGKRLGLGAVRRNVDDGSPVPMPPIVMIFPEADLVFLGLPS